MAEQGSSSSSSLLWTYIRAITQFQRPNGGTSRVSRGRNRQNWSYSHADSFIYKYTTRNFGKVSEESECDLTESEDLEGDRERDGGESSVERIESCTKFVVKPDGKFLYYWLFFVTCAVVYYLWFLVARATWLRKNHNMAPVWRVFDTVSDAIYLIDIIVQLRTGYLEHGILVKDGKLLAKKYVRTIYFVCDVLPLFPLHFICSRFVAIDRSAIFKCLRFSKVYRARQFSLKVESAASHPNGVRIFNLVHLLFLLTHWFAAIYFSVSEVVGLGDGNWVYPNDTGEYGEILRQYLASFYWSTITLTTIGDIPRPESNLEYVLQILGYMLGVFVFATIVGQVGTVVENRKSVRLLFERHVDNAKRYMRENKVPHEVQKPILRWYEYAWTRGQMTGRGDVNGLGLLPTKLRTELALHVNLKTLKKVSFFRRCQPEFLHDLVLKMQLTIITPGELLCRKGEIARDVFIVSDGVLEVIGKRGRILRQLETGDFFGEIRPMVGEEGCSRRKVDVRSVGYSELFTISKEDIMNLLRDHPQAKKVLEETARSYHFNRSKRRKKASRGVKPERSSQTFKEENETKDATAGSSHSGPSGTKTNDAEASVSLVVPSYDHVGATSPSGQSCRTKQRKKENRRSLRYIPEGTTKKRRSLYRKISEEVTGDPEVVERREKKRVTFGATTRAESVVEIPTDIATIVEHKMDLIGDDVKKLLAYTRQLEEKIQTLTEEKELLEDELAALRETNSAFVDNEDETNL